MSLLVHEFSQILDRVMVIAPRRKSLNQLFEALNFDLTTNVGAQQKLDLQSAALSAGPICAWNSYTLGRRSGADMRLTMIGFALEHSPPPANAFEMVDSILLWAPPDEPLCERYFSLDLPQDISVQPCIAVGVRELASDSPHRLRQLALKQWLQRKFLHVHHIAKADDYFSQGMEWVLSFSI